MLVLTRRVEEKIIIRDDIIVTVLSVEGDKVKLGITAPREVTVLRQELYQAVQDQNLAAARLKSGSQSTNLGLIKQLITSKESAGEVNSEQVSKADFNG